MSASSSVIYIAHAYSHLAPEDKTKAVRKTSAYANHLIEQGHIVFNPLSMYHYIDKAIQPNKITHYVWMTNCIWWLLLCGCVHHIKHPSDSLSFGLEIEQAMAAKHNIPWEEVNIDLIEGAHYDHISTKESKRD